MVWYNCHIDDVLYLLPRVYVIVWYNSHINDLLCLLSAGVVVLWCGMVWYRRGL